MIHFIRVLSHAPDEVVEVARDRGLLALLLGDHGRPVGRKLAELGPDVLLVLGEPALRVLLRFLEAEEVVPLGEDDAGETLDLGKEANEQSIEFCPKL